MGDHNGETPPSGEESLIDILKRLQGKRSQPRPPTTDSTPDEIILQCLVEKREKFEAARAKLNRVSNIK